MNNLEIDKLLSNVDGFVGTFPSNCIPAVQFRPAAYVVNTAPIPDEYGGDHWVAIILNKGAKGEYFDSFGLAPIEYSISKFMSDSCPNGYTFTTKMIQSPRSSVCGLYCIDYIRERLLNKTSKSDYLASFKSDFNANDSLVIVRQPWQLFARLL